jgi:hypothetical protein
VPAVAVPAQRVPLEPKPRTPTKRWEDEPANGFDSAPTLTTAADALSTTTQDPPDAAVMTPRSEPSAQTPRAVPAPAPATQAQAAPAMPSPATQGSPSPIGSRAAVNATAAVTAGLGSAMREEVWAIVRAAVEEAVGPLVARQRELEARLARAESQPRAEAPREPERAAQAFASIPITTGPSLAPAASPVIPRSPAVPTSISPKSISPGSYGVIVSIAPKPSLDLEHAGPVDIGGFDGGARKRRVGQIVVVLILLIVISVVTMTVLSHN